MSPGLTKWVRWSGYPALALVACAFGLQWTFPLDRIQRKLETTLGSSYDVTIGEIARGFWPGTFSLRKVAVQPRPSKPSETPWLMFVDEIDVSVSVLAAIGGVGKGNFDVTLGSGRLEGSVKVSAKTFALEFTGTHLPGDKLPILSDALGGPPLVGKLRTQGKLAMIVGNVASAAGQFEFGCEGPCTFGDGKAKFKPRTKQAGQTAFVGEGFSWGEVRIASFDFAVDVKGGKAGISKWNFVSPDAVLEAELAVTLGKTMDDSTVERGCFRYKVTPDLQARESTTADAIVLTGGALDSATGLYNVKMTGLLSSARAVGKVCADGDVKTVPTPLPAIRPVQFFDARPMAPVPTVTPPSIEPVVPATGSPTNAGMPMPLPARVIEPSATGPGQVPAAGAVPIPAAGTIVTPPTTEPLPTEPPPPPLEVAPVPPVVE